VLRQEQHLLDEALADDVVVALEAEAQGFAVEDLVLDGARLDLPGLVVVERRPAEALHLGLLERGQGAAVERDVTRRPRLGCEGEEQSTQDEELERAMARGERRSAPAERVEASGQRPGARREHGRGYDIDAVHHRVPPWIVVGRPGPLMTFGSRRIDRGFVLESPSPRTGLAITGRQACRAPWARHRCAASVPPRTRRR